MWWNWFHYSFKWQYGSKVPINTNIELINSANMNGFGIKLPFTPAFNDSFTSTKFLSINNYIRLHLYRKLKWRKSSSISKINCYFLSNSFNHRRIFDWEMKIVCVEGYVCVFRWTVFINQFKFFIFVLVFYLLKSLMFENVDSFVFYLCLLLCTEQLIFLFVADVFCLFEMI